MWFTAFYSIAKLFQTKPFSRGSCAPRIHPSRELQCSSNREVPTMLPLLLEARAAAEVGYGLRGKWWSVAFYFYMLSFHLYTGKGTAASNLTSKSRAWYGNLSGIVDAILNWPMRLKCQLLSLRQLCVALVAGLFCCLFNFCSSSCGSGVREKLCSHFFC